MELNSYQQLADLTAEYPGKGEIKGLIYAVTLLNSEAGEVAGKLSKYMRGDTNDLDREGILKELGDTLWAAAAVATNMGWTLEFVGDDNLSKLQDRKERGVIKGSGDAR